HRVAAFADEQRRHRHQSAGRRRIYRRHHLGRLWRPARSAERVVEDISMNIEVSRKKLDLSSAIAEGDIRVLLMVLVHMTGDQRWLEPPYKPKRDVRLIPDLQAGVPYTIVERNAEVGGTWYVNRYPGCGVDTPNHSYSFSFGARNPWTRYFAQRQELLDYLKKVALEYDIRKHLRLNTELKSSHW